jgi:predicted small secreted protein
MMKKRILLVLAVVVLLLSMFLAGCKELNGVTQETYDKAVAELNEFKARYTDALTKYDDLLKEKDAVDAQLQEARAEIADLQNQITSLQGENSLTGATLAETAEKIVKYYHDTHVYTTSDYFVCSDMASEVWNMLKAQGISSVIVVGNKDAAIGDILQSNHAWVLAKVDGGKDLALETTGGYSVLASQNPLYYRGWTFASPADLKANNDLRKEYNIRVEIRNNINNEANKVVDLHNNSSSQTQADKYKAVYDKLVELRTEQENILNNIMAQINSLATVLL